MHSSYHWKASLMQNWYWAINTMLSFSLFFWNSISYFLISLDLWKCSAEKKPKKNKHFYCFRNVFKGIHKFSLIFKIHHARHIPAYWTKCPLKKDEGRKDGGLKTPSTFLVYTNLKQDIRWVAAGRGRWYGKASKENSKQ